MTALADRRAAAAERRQRVADWVEPRRRRIVRRFDAGELTEDEARAAVRGVELRAAKRFGWYQVFFALCPPPPGWRWPLYDSDPVAEGRARVYWRGERP